METVIAVVVRHIDLRSDMQSSSLFYVVVDLHVLSQNKNAVRILIKNSLNIPYLGPFLSIILLRIHLAARL